MTLGAERLRSLEGALGGARVLEDVPGEYLHDALTGPAIERRADALVLPETTEQVAALVGWCYENEVPLTTRGGGTGLTGGAVPAGGLLVSMERMDRVRRLDPLEWRAEVEAGVTTGRLQRVARENGLWFPPDPGAAEQSQIGGNVATNAGGPHSFKYGTTGDFVMGLEVVVPPGRVVRAGGAVRKTSTGYDLRRLFTGSEGTLGLITAAWIRLLPAPEAQLPLLALFESTEAGCEAIAAAVGSGLQPATLDFLDPGTIAATAAAIPGYDGPPERFGVIAEADGSEQEAGRTLAELAELFEGCGAVVLVPEGRSGREALWRWRDGVSGTVTGLMGGKVSEDVVVPVDRLRDAIEATVRVAEAHGLKGMSWGHGGDGNLHSTFLVDGPEAPREQLERVEAATADLLREVVGMGGSISGEHGIGWLKRGYLGLQMNPDELAIQSGIKRQLDPKGLLNPGKVLP